MPNARLSSKPFEEKRSTDESAEYSLSRPLLHEAKNLPLARVSLQKWLHAYVAAKAARFSSKRFEEKRPFRMGGLAKTGKTALLTPKEARFSSKPFEDKRASPFA